MIEAEQLVGEGLSLEDARDLVGAEQRYRRAAELSPDWSVPHYNLGLLCKHQRRWVESAEYNRKAVAFAPDDKGAWWNLGIAATALEDWTEARRAWTACGLQTPSGNGPPEFRFGWTPVRLDPEGDAEVVWADRIDPARARILSVPLPWSRHNHGEIVLTDGAPDGHRLVNGRQYPVFNVLQVLIPSPLRKYVLELATTDAAAVEALTRCADELGAAAEDWGRSTNILCAECSRGTPHEHPDAEAAPAHPHCGLAARDDEHAETVIHTWLAREPRADLARWFDADLPGA